MGSTVPLETVLLAIPKRIVEKILARGYINFADLPSAQAAKIQNHFLFIYNDHIINILFPAPRYIAKSTHGMKEK